jgi:hypothetical protein
MATSDIIVDKYKSYIYQHIGKLSHMVAIGRHQLFLRSLDLAEYLDAESEAGF